MDIRLNLSNAFLNKENLTGKQSAFGDSFYPATVTLTELAAHIASGQAFTMHAFKGNRRIGTQWLSSQIVGLDLDDCPLSAAEIAALPDIRDHAWLVYPSPSSTPQKPKTRVLFVLPSAITEPKRWQALQLGVMAHFADLNPDKACKDLARLFYGSTQPGHIILGNVAGWEWLGGLCAPLATADYEKTLIRQQENRQVVTSGTRAEAYTRTAFNKAIDELAGAGAGERNATLFKVSAQLRSMALGGWPGIDSATVRSAIQAVYVRWENSAKSEKTMDNGFKAAVAKELLLPVDDPSPNKTNRESIPLENAATLAPFTADRTFNSRYVNQASAGLLDATCLALKSPTGSGKSQWAAEATTGAPSLLTIAFRQSLVRNQADLYGALAYDAINGRDSYLVASADRVSTTIDSLHKFSNRIFDTIIIDEWVSFLGHISSAGTLQEKAAFTLDLFKRMIASANRVIVMDAHLTDDTLAELIALREDVVCVENTYTQPKVPTQILPNRLAFFSTALSRIKAATAPVLLGVTSPAEARVTKDLIVGCYPDKRVRVVTKNQSHLIDTQSFIRAINVRLAEIDVLIFNGAMSTGVDIQADVDSIIGLIDRPLSPADGVQMLGRARNARMRFARVPDSIEGLDKDPAEIFQNMELAADLNRVETSRPVRALARLHARHEARRNAEMSNYLPIFRAYCHADGSDTQAAVVRFDKAIAEKIKAIREAHTAQKRVDTLAVDRVPTVTPEMLDHLRETGLQEITSEIDAGYLRHKIESATGQAVTGCLYDKYHTRAARVTLYRVDISTAQNAIDIDQRENSDNLPLHQRTNQTAMRALFTEGLRALGATNLDELPAAIMNATAEHFKGFGIWASRNAKRFAALLNYRGTHDGDLSDDVKAVRFFLKRFGVTLTRKQVMRDGVRFMSYAVDAQEIAELTAIIAQRRLKAAEEREKTITTKRQYKSILPFCSNDGEGDKSAPNITKSSTGASKTNPFSRTAAATEAA